MFSPLVSPSILETGANADFNVLVGGRKIEHLKDNIQALSIKLTDKQIEFLESVKPQVAEFPNNFIGEDPHMTGTAGPLAGGTAQISWVRAPKAIGHE